MADMLLPWLMSKIIDLGVNNPDTELGMQMILKYGGWMLVVAALALLSGFLAGRFSATAATGFAANLRDTMYRNIQRFSFSNIDRFSTAGLITRLTTDVSNLQMSYQMLLRICVRAPTMLICALVMAFTLHPSLSLVFVVAIAFLVVVLSLIIFKATGLFDKVFQKYDDLNASVQENVSAIRVVKAFVREDHERGKFSKAADNVYRMFVKAESIVTLNGPVMNFAVYGCILVLSWLGAKAIVLEGFTEGGLMALYGYVTSILMSLMMISMIFVMMSMSLACARRVSAVINEEPDLTSPAQPVTEIPDGSIDFDHVDFS
ncbi:MAG: ABC transporter ATP-binding protein, partial [Oscillospiraceae bacterium]|nr:ABC transporter ATP-binding protein [Oscillospiraceae bacterium]